MFSLFLTFKWSYMWKMNPFRFKIAECLLNVLNNCFYSRICIFKIPQTRIAIFPLLAYGSHIMAKVLFYQGFFFFFSSFSTNDPCAWQLADDTIMEQGMSLFVHKASQMLHTSALAGNTNTKNVCSAVVKKIQCWCGILGFLTSRMSDDKNGSVICPSRFKII